MTLPFRRQYDDQTLRPSDRADDLVIARLRAMDDTGGPNAAEVAMARGRVWQRLVAEHPSLQTRPTAIPAPPPLGLPPRPERISPCPCQLAAGHRVAGGRRSMSRSWRCWSSDWSSAPVASA